MRALASCFLRLGCTAFGGPAVHLALFYREFVERRGWLGRERFLELQALSQLIPGPNSTELALLLGAERDGRRGLLLAGLCFILPGVLLSALLAELYLRYGSLPELAGVLRGVQAIMLALLVWVALKLSPLGLRKPSSAILLAACLMAGALGADEWWVLLGAGLSAWLLAEIRGTATALAAAPLELLFVFLKIGGLLYGSGYVLLALLEEELVTKRAWISSQQLLDAIAIGQATPGPLFSSATVIGWWLDGASGAALATCGIFLPAFVLLLLLARWLPRLTQRAGVRAFLTGVELAALALLMLVTVRLSVTTLQETWTIGLAITGLMLLVRTRLNPTWWILLGALAGWLAGAG